MSECECLRVVDMTVCDTEYRQYDYRIIYRIFTLPASRIASNIPRERDISDCETTGYKRLTATYCCLLGLF